MAETQAQKEARWKAEGYEKVGNVWVKPGTKAYDDAKALVASRQSKQDAADAATKQDRENMDTARAAARAAGGDITEIARVIAKPGNVVDNIKELAGQDAARQAEENAAKAPADTFDATLRELARARTQLQMAATNGRAGSIAGVGTDNYSGQSIPSDIVNVRSNQRLTAGRTDVMRRASPNRSVQRSAFNLPFVNAGRLGLLR